MTRFTAATVRLRSSAATATLYSTGWVRFTPSVAPVFAAGACFGIAGWFAVQQFSRMGDKGKPAVPELVKMAVADYPDESREVRLEVEEKGQWKEIAREKVNDIGWSALFRVEEWDDTRDVPYRIRHGKKSRPGALQGGVRGCGLRCRTGGAG